MLELDGVEKAYDGFRLGPVDLSVEKEVVAVLGPSGCGKTTLLSVVAGIVAPDAGVVRLGGDRLDGVPLDERGTAYVFQDAAVFPHLTARANLAYAAADPKGIDALAETFELTDVLDRRAGTLSGGERRRVEVARALAARPSALLLDEPTTGLDAPIRRRLRSQLREVLQGLDIPVLYVTHDQDEAAVVADRVAVMNEGILLQVAAPSDVFHRPAHPFIARFTGNPNVFAARLERAETADPHEETGGASGAVVDWNGRAVRVGSNGRAWGAGVDAEGGETVWLCIRPEEIHVDPAPNGPSSATNVFTATIRTRTYEGGMHVLTLQMAANGAPEAAGGSSGAELEARMLHARARALDLAPGTPVHVRLPEDAVHLIPR